MLRVLVLTASVLLLSTPLAHAAACASCSWLSGGSSSAGPALGSPNSGSPTRVLYLLARARQRVEENSGALAEVDSLYAEALDLLATRAPEEPFRRSMEVRAWMHRSRLLLLLGKDRPARIAAGIADQLAEDHLAERDRLRWIALTWRGRVLDHLGDPTGAEPLLRRALALSREHHQGTELVGDDLLCLARCLEGQGRHGEAAPLRLERSRLEGRAPGPTDQTSSAPTKG